MWLYRLKHCPLAPFVSKRCLGPHCELDKHKTTLYVTQFYSTGVPEIINALNPSNNIVFTDDAELSPHSSESWKQTKDQAEFIPHNAESGRLPAFLLIDKAEFIPHNDESWRLPNCVDPGRGYDAVHEL